MNLRIRKEIWTLAVVSTLLLSASRPATASPVRPWADSAQWTVWAQGIAFFRNVLPQLLEIWQPTSSAYDPNGFTAAAPAPEAEGPGVVATPEKSSSAYDPNG